MNDLYQYGVYCLGSYCTVLQWIWGGMWDRQIPITHPLHPPPPPEKELGRGEMHRGAKGYLLTRAPLKELQLHFGCASGQTLDPPLRLWERLTHTEQERERERLEEEDWCCCGHASQGCKQKFFFVVPPLSSHCKWMGWGGSSGSVRSILLSFCVRGTDDTHTA